MVVEPQGRASDDKDQSWPVYATTARKANKCPRAVLVVACWDPAEADKCRRIIATGHPGLVFVPIVIDRDSAPPLAVASPYLVLFNAIIGAVDLDTEEGRALVVGAITATGVEDARFRSLCDIILGIASDAAHEHLEELMGITYKSKFVDGWYQQGRAAGEAEGKAEGKAEGIALGAARTRAEDILFTLESRGLEPTRGERELIESCEDLARLHTWFQRALTVATVAMVFEDEKREATRPFGKSKSLTSEFKIDAVGVSGVQRIDDVNRLAVVDLFGAQLASLPTSSPRTVAMTCAPRERAICTA